VFITEFGIVNSIAGVIIAILACSTVVFTLWALVVYGIMAIDINEAFNKLNFLKKKDEIKIYTTVIRPVGFVFIDVFVYYFIPYRITENQFNINNMWISFIWCLFFCFSKIMIYRTKEPRALIGTWYISVYIIGVLLLGVTENFITLMVYLLFFNSLWVFKE